MVTVSSGHFFVRAYSAMEKWPREWVSRMVTVSSGHFSIALYARTKKWPLETVTIRLTHSRVYAKDCLDCVVRDDTLLDRIDTAVQLSGPLTAEQEQKLMEVAHKCPVHRTLKSQIEIREGS